MRRNNGRAYSGKSLGKMAAEYGEVKVVTDDDRSHSGAAFRARDDHAVDDRFHDAGAGDESLGNLAGRNVLAPPTERVADCGRQNRSSRFHPCASDRRCETRHLPSQKRSAEPLVLKPLHPYNLRTGRPSVRGHRKSCRSPRRRDLGSSGWRSLPRYETGSPVSISNSTSATGNRCARNDGTRPIAPGLPSQLYREKLPSVAA